MRNTKKPIPAPQIGSQSRTWSLPGAINSPIDSARTNEAAPIWSGQVSTIAIKVKMIPKRCFIYADLTTDSYYRGDRSRKSSKLDDPIITVAAPGAPCEFGGEYCDYPPINNQHKNTNCSAKYGFSFVGFSFTKEATSANSNRNTETTTQEMNYRPPLNSLPIESAYGASEVG